VVFQRTDFVLRFGDFLVGGRADFFPQEILKLLIHRTEICLKCMDNLSLILLFPLL
jgi:hypothetical protein